MTPQDGHVDYESFGAAGDGVTDDLPAICQAHAFANARGLPVRSRPDATYHLGRRALTAAIATDTDWSTSRFRIDDRDVEDHKQPLLEVRSLLDPVTLSLDRLGRDQRQVDLRPDRDCFVRIEQAEPRRYIRRGLNRNAGGPQHDCFVLKRDGSIQGDIDWTYERVSRVEAQPIDETTLHVRGGVFETFANHADNSGGYDYWGRNLVVQRSRTEVQGLTHYVVGETSVGCPYRGFVSVSRCADVTLRDCWFTGHKIYQTIGNAGKPVSMGSYDVHANSVVGLSLVGCRMNHILDRTRWGVIATNHCKDILLEDCHLSRMDTHMGVSGAYTIRRCTLGYVGLNAIGRGVLTVEDSTLYGPHLVNFRGDYGSTWQGRVVVRNSRWTPACGDPTRPHLFGVHNDGMHDFGYPCSMPEYVEIDGLYVDDSNTPHGYDGPYLFTDPDATTDHEGELPAERPFPYAPCRRVTIRGFETASGKPPRISPNAGLTADVLVVQP